MIYDYASRIPLRKPPWLQKNPLTSASGLRTESLIEGSGLVTVCLEAGCPNRGECYSSGQTAFLVMGPVCTRSCRFCLMTHGLPFPLDPTEPERLARAAARLRLRHIVVTSVTRDDLPDGGASHFQKIVSALRKTLPSATIELLVPDFGGNIHAIRLVAQSRPDVFNHNCETVPRLSPLIRPEADYRRSLFVLENAKASEPGLLTKSGLLVGLGETEDEVVSVMTDLRRVGCDILTIGQYLAPSRKHFPVHAYIEPSMFDRYRRIGYDLGFRSIAAGPFVRSSYHAEADFLAACKKGGRRRNQS